MPPTPRWLLPFAIALGVIGMHHVTSPHPTPAAHPAHTSAPTEAPVGAAPHHPAHGAALLDPPPVDTAPHHTSTIGVALVDPDSGGTELAGSVPTAGPADFALAGAVPADLVLTSAGRADLVSVRAVSADFMLASGAPADLALSGGTPAAFALPSGAPVDLALAGAVPVGHVPQSGDHDLFHLCLAVLGALVLLLFAAVPAPFRLRAPARPTRRVPASRAPPRTRPLLLTLCVSRR